ncbi:MAG: PQQ-dependent sugar dehydrogenase [Bacillus sp. (in: firmicutes)]
MKKLGLLFMMAGTLWGCSGEDASKKEEGTDLQKNSEVDTVAENLKSPWSLQESGGSFYVSEKGGSVAVIKDGEVKREAVQFEKNISTQPESGFLGFLLHPHYGQNRQAYGYYTYDEAGESKNRVVVLERKEGEWIEIEVLLDGIPSGQYHHGGRMEIGPDQKLYVTTGDALEENRAQDQSSLNGKILRMELDGGIPADNPDPDSYVYSYGHRNPQGLAWDEEGNLYSSEHGSSAKDELNLIEPGKNYGWPVIEGDETEDGMEEPLVHSGEETWAPSGMASSGDVLYVAALRGEKLLAYSAEQGAMRIIFEGAGRLRDVLVINDELYFISNNTDGRGEPKEGDDKLYKLSI